MNTNIINQYVMDMWKLDKMKLYVEYTTVYKFYWKTYISQQQLFEYIFTELGL